jgi:dTDP-4-dehydrorhamnose 3,5-epimerase
MEIERTKLADCFIIKTPVFKDSRGYFFESFNQSKFEALTGANGQFVQDNQSASTYGVVRGLHYQKGEHAQAKLVRAIAGIVLDVAVDLRKESKTYGQWVSVVLSGDNNLQMYVPRGFAHGFAVLSESAVFAYKCDNQYNKESEGGLRHDDPDLNIDWGIPKKEMMLSDKDLVLPNLQDL